MNIKKDILWRIGIIYFMMLAIAFLILFNIIKVQFVEGAKWREKASLLTQKDITIEASRGSILSEDGQKLACSVPSYRIFMDTRAPGLTAERFSHNIDSLSLRLSRLYNDKSPAAYKRDITNARKKGNRYYSISNQRISVIELKRAKQFPIFRNGANKGGFIVEQYDTRKMPFGSLAERIVGKLYSEKDTGKVGIEYSYDKQLRGVNGIGDNQRIGGRWVNNIQVEPIDGDDVVTTLNVEIQDVAEQALKEQLIRHNAQYGVAVVMEVSTGQVKAMVNLFRVAPSTYTEDHYNFAIGTNTEPGSTFKLASLMVALEDGVVDIDDMVDTENGTIQYFDRTMRDSEHDKYGLLTVKEAFERSSNVGISKIIYFNYKKNPEKFLDGIDDIGINQSLELEVAGEDPPYFKKPNDKLWSGITLPWMAIGYEVKMSPLQVLTFYNAVANNGKMVKPMFVKEITRYGSTVKAFDTEVLRSSICSGSTLRKVRTLLEGVVEQGTAMNLKNDHYKIAGKTGTAQIAHGSKGYKNEGVVSYQASFVGYFPADKPRYSCIVVVNGPSNNVYYGNVVAGSVFKEIADQLYATNLRDTKYYKQPDPILSSDMPYTKGGQKDKLKDVLWDLDLEYTNHANSDWVGSKANDKEIEIVEKKIDKGLVPSVKGMGARDAIFLLEGLGLRVTLYGAGRVVEQSIQPGGRYNKGNHIVLKLS